MKRQQVRYEVQQVPQGAQLTFITLGPEPRTLLQITLGPKDANRFASAILTAALSELSLEENALEKIQEWNQ